MSHRLPDWQARLAHYITDIAPKAYQIGAHDCALFAAGAVQAVTGRDLAAEWRGYASYADGRKAMLAQGIRSIADLPGAYLPECHPAFATAGDIALIDAEGREVLAVVQGEAVYVLRPDGLGLVPRRAMLRAWKC